MFTGIVEEVGTLLHIKSQGNTLRLTIQAKKVMEEIQLGDSIAVNGVCLTVVHFDQRSFSVDCVPETVRKTNLKHLQAGSPLNLERAMAAGGRFGGHIVQGHVDSTGSIISRLTEENAVVFRIQPHQQPAMRYLLSTGSITVDGISLTVVDVEDTWFSIYIIPHTLAQTVLKHKQVGDEVNLECDILGKYIERLLNYGKEHNDSSYSHLHKNSYYKSSGGLSKSMLEENGYT